MTEIVLVKLEMPLNEIGTEEDVSNQPAITISLSNGDTHILYSDDFDWCSIEDYTIQTQGRFLFCMFRHCDRQGASTGIWDAETKDWVFKERGDELGVMGMLYSEKYNSFIGYDLMSTYSGTFSNLIIIKKNDPPAYNTFSLDHPDAVDRIFESEYDLKVNSTNYIDPVGVKADIEDGYMVFNEENNTLSINSRHKFYVNLSDVI